MMSSHGHKDFRRWCGLVDSIQPEQLWNLSLWILERDGKVPPLSLRFLREFFFYNIFFPFYFSLDFKFFSALKLKNKNTDFPGNLNEFPKNITVSHFFSTFYFWLQTSTFFLLNFHSLQLFLHSFGFFLLTIIFMEIYRFPLWNHWFFSLFSRFIFYFHEINGRRNRSLSRNFSPPNLYNCGNFLQRREFGRKAKGISPEFPRKYENSQPVSVILCHNQFLTNQRRETTENRYGFRFFVLTGMFCCESRHNIFDVSRATLIRWR